MEFRVKTGVSKCLLTSLKFCSIRDITKEVAAAVIKEAIEEDLAEGYREMDARELQKLNEVFFLGLSTKHTSKAIRSHIQDHMINELHLPFLL